MIPGLRQDLTAIFRAASVQVKSEEKEVAMCRTAMV